MDSVLTNIVIEFKQKFSQQPTRPSPDRRGSVRPQQKPSAKFSSQVEALIETLKVFSGFEMALLKGAVFECFSRGRLRLVSTGSKNQPAYASQKEDRAAIFRAYQRKLNTNISGFKALHYYENRLRTCISEYLDSHLSENWPRHLLEFLEADYHFGRSPETGRFAVEMSPARPLKMLYAARFEKSTIVKRLIFNDVFVYVRIFFKRIVESERCRTAVNQRVSRMTTSEFMSTLSLNELQRLVLSEWFYVRESSYLTQARKLALSKSRIADNFRIIAAYRNQTYHHVSDGGASRAVRKMNEISCLPSRFLETACPIPKAILNDRQAKELCARIFAMHPGNRRSQMYSSTLLHICRTYPEELVKAELARVGMESSEMKKGSQRLLEAIQKEYWRNVHATQADCFE